DARRGRGAQAGHERAGPAGAARARAGGLGEDHARSDAASGRGANGGDRLLAGSPVGCSPDSRFPGQPAWARSALTRARVVGSRASVGTVALPVGAVSRVVGTVSRVVGPAD